MSRRFLIAFAVVSTLLPVCTARAEIQVGAAMRVITPDPLLPVSGGMGIPKPAKEKQGELTARAIVFRKGEVSVAVVSLDLLGLSLGAGRPGARQGEPHPGRRTS